MYTKTLITINIMYYFLIHHNNPNFHRLETLDIIKLYYIGLFLRLC
jgi:predicted cupin superfamily sugar epimerase